MNSANHLRVEVKCMKTLFASAFTPEGFPYSVFAGFLDISATGFFTWSIRIIFRFISFSNRSKLQKFLESEQRVVARLELIF